MKKNIAEKDGNSPDTHAPAYGIDRYAYNQGYNAMYDFQIFENEEPCLISRGGQPSVVRESLENLSGANRKSVRHRPQVGAEPTNSGRETDYTKTWLFYQKTVGALCAIDYKGVKNEMAEMDKLIIQRRK